MMTNSQQRNEEFYATSWAASEFEKSGFNKSASRPLLRASHMVDASELEKVWLTIRGDGTAIEQLSRFEAFIRMLRYALRYDSYELRTTGSEMREKAERIVRYSKRLKAELCPLVLPEFGKLHVELRACLEGFDIEDSKVFGYIDANRLELPRLLSSAIDLESKSRPFTEKMLAEAKSDEQYINETFDEVSHEVLHAITEIKGDFVTFLNGCIELGYTLAKMEPQVSKPNSKEAPRTQLVRNVAEYFMRTLGRPCRDEVVIIATAYFPKLPRLTQTQVSEIHNQRRLG